MESCIFCKIAGGEVPADIVYSDDELIALVDMNPEAPVHLLIIPKKHIPSPENASEEDAPLLGKMFLLAARLAEKNGLGDGFRLVLNVGSDGGQTVDHIHLHLLGGRHMLWPPG